MVHQTAINKFQYIQNSAARVLTFSKKIFSHYSRSPQTSLATFPLLYSIQDTPHHLQSTSWSCPSVYFWSHSYLLSSSHTTIIWYWFTVNSMMPQVTIVWWDRCFVPPPPLWNSIPKQICDLASLQNFKTHLKTYISFLVSLISDCICVLFFCLLSCLSVLIL